MAALDTLRRNKTTIQDIFCADNRLILNKVFETDLITKREYDNLKNINKEDVEGHVVKLVDKIMNKGDETCQAFLLLLQTDKDIKSTYPDLKNIQLNYNHHQPEPVQASSGKKDVKHPHCQKPQNKEKKDISYEKLVDRLNNREYKNWLKAGRCLLILMEGLHPFINQHMRDFHKDLLNQNTQLQKPCQTSSCKPKGNKFVPNCQECTEWKTVILKHHRQSSAIVYWENCSPPSWRTDHWELAKAYMPRGQGKVKGSDQCDTSALLNLINFCDHFQSVDLNIVRKVIQCRNELMHSSKLLIKDEWMTDYQISLQNLVQQFNHVPQMPTIGQQINKMLSTDLSIQVCGFDQKDSGFLKGLESDSVRKWESSADLISQWEAQLLQETLQELLHAFDDDTKTQDTEQLKSLGGFLQANRDLGERFSAEIQAINSLETRE